MSTCLLSLAAISGCTTSSVLPKASEPNYRLEIRDAPQHARFELTLVSDDPKALCVDVDQWPNRAGQVDGGSQSMWLLVDGETIPGKSAPYSTYCPGGCRYLEVKPGQRLIGFIGYDQFEGDPTSHSNKALNFRVHPIHCKATTRRAPQI